MLAVACDGQALTYGELDLRAKHIACALVELGIGGGAPVVVLADRGHDLVASLLGCLWPGARSCA